jgi:hypothetical protein
MNYTSGEAFGGYFTEGAAGIKGAAAIVDEDLIQGVAGSRNTLLAEMEMSIPPVLCRVRQTRRWREGR